jgi:UDP-4-amino-4,6-dideoxy-N-acetyl-beta-L-altrosamine transaminase
MIPYGKHDITQEDIDSVLEVLQSDFITQGPRLGEFENLVSQFCGAGYAAATNSATSALHIACLALELGPGDALWTSPISFVASANCGLYCGASVGFVDIDPQTYNLCADKLQERLKAAAANGTLPKVVVPVHLAGQSCDMQRIHQLSQEYGFKIIEDASHAIGGKYQGSPIGGCQYSDITVFSFHPVKIITTAEGGLATTNSAELIEKMRLYRGHGITRDAAEFKSGSDGDWYYEQQALGFNYRMTELQAALGVSQMQRLEEVVQRRHQIAQRYDESLKELPLVLPAQGTDAYSSYHLYPVLIDPARTDLTRAQLFAQLRERGIGVNVHYIPIYRQPYYQAMKLEECPLANAEDYYARAVSLPLYPGLDEGDMQFIEQQLRECFGSSTAGGGESGAAL